MRRLDRESIKSRQKVERNKPVKLLITKVVSQAEPIEILRAPLQFIFAANLCVNEAKSPRTVIDRPLESRRVKLHFKSLWDGLMSHR